jgi:hypothetical protein
MFEFWKHIEKSSSQYIDSMYDESLMCHGLNLNPGSFGDFTFIFVRVENRVCLSHGV